MTRAAPAIRTRSSMASDAVTAAAPATPSVSYTSVTWRPMVKDGFSARPASW